MYSLYIMLTHWALGSHSIQTTSMPSSYLILSYSCAVVKIFVSPMRMSQKGRQPLRCLLKQGTGLMVRALIFKGLECGRLGFSDTMLHT